MAITRTQFEINIRNRLLAETEAYYLSKYGTNWKHVWSNVTINPEWADNDIVNQGRVVYYAWNPFDDAFIIIC